MHFHVTEKLRKKLHLPPLPPALPALDNRMDWYANVFTVGRVQYVLTTHAASLYSVLTYGRGMTDSDEFLRKVFQLLREHLKQDGHANIFGHHIEPNLDTIFMTRTRDRSVLGSMNDMVNHCKFMQARDDLSPWELTGQINNSFYSAIKYQQPRKRIADIFLSTSP